VHAQTLRHARQAHTARCAGPFEIESHARIFDNDMQSSLEQFSGHAQSASSSTKTTAAILCD
jgi:hypothetical protein